MALRLIAKNTTGLDDIEPWMYECASTRPGAYQVTYYVDDKLPLDSCCFPAGKRWGKDHNPRLPSVIRVNLTTEEYSQLDKVVSNQEHVGGKESVRAAAAYNRAALLWPGGSKDELAMRKLGPWAVIQTNTCSDWVYDETWWEWFLRTYFCECMVRDNKEKKRCVLDPHHQAVKTSSAALCVVDGKKIYCGIEPRGKKRVGQMGIPLGKMDPGETPLQAAVREGKEEGGIICNASNVEPAFTFTGTYEETTYQCEVFMVSKADVTLMSESDHPDFLDKLAFRTAKELREEYSDQVCNSALNYCVTGTRGQEQISYKLAPTPKGIPFRIDATCDAREAGLATLVEPQAPTNDAPRNELGYVKLGHGNEDHHPLGGVNASDSELRVTRVDRLVENSAGYGIIGQTTNSLAEKQVVAALSLPTSAPPNVYARRIEEAINAIKKRITEKQKPYRQDHKLESRMKQLVDEMIGKKKVKKERLVFGVEQITEWWTTHPILDCKSPKWTEERFQRTYEQLLQQVDPTFTFSADVKVEGMVEGKAPRLIIADGDKGQVMALMTIKCIEDLIKAHFGAKTVKGLSKQEAMKRVAEQMKVPQKFITDRIKAVEYRRNSGKQSKMAAPPPPGLTERVKYGVPAERRRATIFEGDGSAWDTTCSAAIRALTENRVIKHVVEVLRTLAFEPSTWAHAHEAACNVEKLMLEWKKNAQYNKLKIDAIRRSGHRGTSTLNWLINFICWHCALFSDPEVFLDPMARRGTDVMGMVRWCNSCFEGDDSILATFPTITAEDPVFKAVLRNWDNMGFNMEIVIREKFALFTGWRFEIDENGTTGIMMPEVARAMGRAGVSASPTMVKAIKECDRAKAVGVSRAAALARASDFKGLAPTVSGKYLNYYLTTADQAEACFEREHMIRITGNVDVEQEINTQEIVREIQMANANSDDLATGNEDGETRRLKATGYAWTYAEKCAFQEYDWAYEKLADFEGFAASLPASFKV
jgi:8-oxo-dGTP pyrophosphatase MutT (NUDIX family)